MNKPNMHSSFHSTRRQLLQRGAITTLGVMGASSFSASPLAAASKKWLDPDNDAALTSDPRIKAMLQHGVDAAVAAGASYAELRFTHTRIRNLNGAPEGLNEQEEITVGARALVKGYWGFASGPVWTMEEGARLGREAAAQATTNTLGKARDMALAPMPVVNNGNWVMPVKIDPFTLHPSQVYDVIGGLKTYVENKRGVGAPWASLGVFFHRRDKAVATSEGSFFTQRTYMYGGGVSINRYEADGLQGAGALDFLSPAGVGSELWDEDKIRDAIDPLIEDIRWNASLPALPLDVGRYEAVLDARAVASLLSGTIGAATELDRALGYEANASGTSYLNDPVAMLGSYRVASPQISITAERTTPGGLATVQWDDEGVTPVTTPILTNGVLTNYQTNRETAAWLANAKPGMAARSTGHCDARYGVDAPLVRTANLQMTPATEANDFNSLVQSMKKGVALKGDLGPNLDWQQLNGWTTSGNYYDVRNGKIVARLVGCSALFRSPELWKGVRAVGGASSRRSFGLFDQKGEPAQRGMHTLYALPMHHEGLTFIDPSRKA